MAPAAGPTAAVKSAPAPKIGNLRQRRRDRAVAYASYFLLGAGLLAPLNALFTAADYYESVWPGRHVDRLITVSYLPATWVTLSLTVRAPLFWARQRVIFAFSGFTLLMAALPAIDAGLVQRGSPGSAEVALGLIIAITALVGVLDGCSQGAIFADAAQLPSCYTHAVIGGTASSGVLISILRIITKAAMPSTREGLAQSTAIYFALAAAICLCCLLAHTLLLPGLVRKMHYTRRLRHLQASVIYRAPATEAALAAGIPAADLLGGDDKRAVVVDAEAALGAGSAHAPPSAAADGPVRWQQVAAGSWRLLLAMVVVYVITLSIFPGVLAEDVRSGLPALDTTGWFAILLLTNYNVFDLVGKNLPFFGLSPSPTAMLLLALARVAFVPLYYVFGARLHSGAAIAVLTVLLGFSNGYLTAMLLTMGPSTVPEGEAAAVLENLLVLSMVTGLMLGAGCGFLWLIGGSGA